MDNTLKDLESPLETLTPRGLSDVGRDDCHQLIDQLVEANEFSANNLNREAGGWKGTAAAAAIALGIGVSGGWFLGVDRNSSLFVENEKAGDAEVVFKLKIKGGQPKIAEARKDPNEAMANAAAEKEADLLKL